MWYPLVTELATRLLSVYLEFRWYPFVTGLAAAGFSVTVRCRVLTLSCQSCYRWLAEPYHHE